MKFRYPLNLVNRLNLALVTCLSLNTRCLRRWRRWERTASTHADFSCCKHFLGIQ
jgi:hypothetical protein